MPPKVHEHQSLTLTEVADAIDVSRQTLWRWRRKRRASVRLTRGIFLRSATVLWMGSDEACTPAVSDAGHWRSL